MYIKYLLTIVVLLSPTLLISQKKGILLSNCMEKATEIVKQLHHVNGTFIHNQVPEIAIQENSTKLASYKDHTIIIDPSLCELCQSFGERSKDALAFITGHELAHCYMEDTTFLFIDYLQGDTSKIAKERAADIYGLFNAYLAGYEAFKLMPDLIHKIYDFYELEDIISNYPPKQERLTMAEETQKQVTELINIYEVANYLSAIGQYHLAGLSYQYLLQFYQGKEIYNNIGVNQALYAMNEATSTHYDLYLYPIEIDSHIRLKKPKAARGREALPAHEKRERTKWLNNALRNFTVVTKMDPSYYTVDINIMCIYILQEKYDEAIRYYQQHFQGSRTKQYPILPIQKESARLALAIAKAQLPVFKKDAKKIFKQLKNSNNAQIAAQAAYNLKILEEGSCGIPDRATCTDLIATVDLVVDSVLIYRKFTSATNKIIKLSNTITLTIDPKSSSTIYQFYEAESPILLFQQIFSKDIPVQDIVNKTGQFNRINTSDGYFLTCATSPCVYHLSSSNQLKGWGKYYAEQIP